jgi:hypothetical protein
VNTQSRCRSFVASVPLPHWRIGFALVAVVLLQLLFALSYLAVFHDPTPRSLPVAVTAPTPQIARQTAEELRSASHNVIDAHAVDTPTEAKAEVEDRASVAAYTVGSAGDQLLVASAAGPSQSQTLTGQFQQLDARQGRTLQVNDIAPLPQSDSRGLMPFYVTLVLIFGGYLGTVLFGLLTTTRAADPRAAAVRLTGLAGFAALSSAVVVLGTHAAFDVLGGHLLQAIAAGTLICFATAATALALQSLLGIIGTGLVIMLFVIFGNPASGGAVSYGFLPTPYRDLGPLTVNGAGVDLLRNLAYFNDHDLTRPLAVLVAWSLIATAGAIALSSHCCARLNTIHHKIAPAFGTGM